jgi:3-oxoacyl-(acyl-carrier-protein) synthase/phosphopantetheinyl transferase
MSRIAIIGMACLYPGAPTLERYWQNIVAGVDAIGEVPPQRWDASFHDPQSTAIDRFYCKRGGFVDAWASFDPLAFGVMPKAAAAAEPDQLLTLKVGYEALRDSGYAERPFARDKTGVIIGRGNYVTAGVLRLEQHVRLLPQVLQTLQDLFPAMPADALQAVRERLQGEFAYYGPDVAAGMIPNLIASRLANRLDLHGPAYTVDAACASSLIALEQACQSLRRGDSDMMLVGGAHLTHDLTFWATFCQLGALSRTGIVRPLSRHADGILAGEGVGMAVLRRLEDAEAAGDRIYAVIEGVGSSSDGRSSSLVAPSVSGQRMALEKAWGRLDFSHDSIGLVEAHGTGTPTGDEAEIETLGQYFGSFSGKGARPVIGSVKSMIGHTMPAAGMAGLIKSALAIHHGVLPPTLHCEDPHPRLDATRFRAIGRAEPWLAEREARVAAVNAFGFGGINAHVVLRGRASNHSHSGFTAGAELPRPPEVLTLSANTPAELLARLERGERDTIPGHGRCRLAIVEPDEKRLALARKAIASGKSWPGRQQVYFSVEGLVAAGGKLAFVFPGVDSTFSPQADDLARYFGKPLPRYCETLNPADSLLKVVLGLLGFNRFLFDILTGLGIRPQAMAGHSVGEWSAMLASGMMDQALSDRTNEGLDFDAVKFPDVQFLAASCGQEAVVAAMKGLTHIAISHDNCPHQVIACGRRDAIAQLESRLREAAVFTQILPIVSGFHSPLFSEHMGWYRGFFSEAQLLDPVVPVWSATLAAPFPSTVAARQQTALDHLLKPVRFRELTEKLYAEGYRVFVQVGTGSLTGFIGDTLTGRPHQALAANQEARSGLAQLTHLCAALWVEGAEFDTRLLQAPAKSEAIKADVSREIPLALGVPLVRIRQPLDMSPWSSSTASISPVPDGQDPVQRLLHDTLSDIEKAGRDVMTLWQRHQSTKAPAETIQKIRHRVSRHLDVTTTIPYVQDHELYPQRKGWPVLADRHPVVPLTMEVMLAREAVEELLPRMKVTEVRNIQAYNWLVVATPKTVHITLSSDDGWTVDVEIEGYFRAQVVVADAFDGAAPPVLGALENPRASAVDAVALYRDQWMFHGPAYQGVRQISAIGDNGIEGKLVVPAGKGSLLDNMGQLAGYWVMEQPSDCLAMPIGVDRIRFLNDDPVVGEQLQASVRIRELDALNAVSDHVLTDADGRARIVIEGWRTRRYQMDKDFWLASRQLQQQGVSRVFEAGIALFVDRYDTAILRDYMARRYLSAPEFSEYENLSPRRRRSWLNGRVAAKDAVRLFLGECAGIEIVHPKELRIENASNGAPSVVPHITDTVPGGIRVSIAHKDGFAIALAGEYPVGVDIERIEVRDENFISLSMHESERQLLGDENPAVSITRAWVAKEAVAKLQGTGLGGNPKAFRLDARQGENLRVNGHWVSTRRMGDHIIGWVEDTSVQTEAIGATALVPDRTKQGESGVSRP